MAPAVLESDAGPDVNEGQVVVESVLANRRENPPRRDRAGDEQEPGERGDAEVAENPAVDPPQYGGLSPLGERHRFVGFGSYVLRLRADEPIIGDLLEDMRCPARRPR